MPLTPAPARFIAAWPSSPLAGVDASSPWDLTSRSAATVQSLLATLPPDEYKVDGDVALHRSATVEHHATLKGPLIVGPRCFIAAGAYLRGGCWLGADVIIGPGAELKSSFVFAGSKLAHFNFVGDAILGEGVNLEAGSIVCNYRNEREDKQVRVLLDGQLQATGVTKFGAVLGDGCRLGANAVVAPGGLLLPGTVVGRGQLLDQEAQPGLAVPPSAPVRQSSGRARRLAGLAAR